MTVISQTMFTDNDGNGMEYQLVPLNKSGRPVLEWKVVAIPGVLPAYMSLHSIPRYLGPTEASRLAHLLELALRGEIQREEFTDNRGLACIIRRVEPEIEAMLGEVTVVWGAITPPDMAGRTTLLHTNQVTPLVEFLKEWSASAC